MTNNKRCFASRHMHPREWGLFEVCLRLTNGGKNKLFFDGRKMAERFAGVSKDSIYRSVARLVESGWLVQTSPRTKNSDTHKYEKSVYAVLPHDQWIEKHGDSKCQIASPRNETGASPRNETGANPQNATGQSPEHEGQSSECEKPVPRVRHSSVTHNSVKESSEKNNPVNSAPWPKSSGSEFSFDSPDNGSSLTAGKRRLPRTTVPPAGATEELWNDAETELVGYVINGEELLFEGVPSEA